jgi:hypothetical protein
MEAAFFYGTRSHRRALYSKKKPREEAGWTDEVKGNDSVEAEPQQAIEACKMIHVGVRNESMRDTQEFARGQRRHVAEVKRQCPTAETEIDEQCGIRKGIIDEPRLHEPSHIVPFLIPSPRACRSRSVASWRLKALPGRNFVRAI